MRRKLAVAGSFYPAEVDRLSKLLDILCDDKEGQKIEAKAVLVPHTALVYCGRTACAVYKRVRIPKRVVLMGPSHTNHEVGISVYPEGTWETPFEEVNIDEDLLEEVLRYPSVKEEAGPHLYEHSLEVQLPFLFRYAERPFRILPIIFGHLDYETAKDFGKFLGNVLKERDALVVISSDMSHYISAQEAKRKDEILISAMERLQTDELYLKRVQYNITMCGFIPAVVGIEAGKVLGIRQGVLIDYSHSGEITGDHGRIIAYAGMVFV